MQYAIVYGASLGVIGASAWMLSQAVNDTDFDDLKDSDITLPPLQAVQPDTMKQSTKSTTAHANADKVVDPVKAIKVDDPVKAIHVDDPSKVDKSC